MDIGKSFSYVFDDKDWLKKVAIGGLLNIVPIMNLIPGGYALRTLKNVSEGKDKPLPEWDDWGGDLIRGLTLFMAGLIYSIPILMMMALVAISVIAGPRGSSDMQGITIICSAGLCFLSVLWAIIMMVIWPATVIKYATGGQFRSFFRIGDILHLIRENLGDHITAILLTIVAFFIAAPVGGLVCLIGMVFSIFWAVLVSAHLFGQVKAESMPAAPAPSSGASYGDPASAGVSGRPPAGSA